MAVKNFSRVSMLFQIILGLVGGVLNYAATNAALHFGIPLFMDTIFTVTASCFGWIGGILAGFVYHLLVAIAAQGLAFYAHPSDMIFFFCSLTVVWGIRIVLKSRTADFFALLVCAVSLALVISFEGGLFYTLLFENDAYHIGIDNRAVSTLIYLFLTEQMPVFVSAVLARIPVNLVDKLIAVFAGFYLAVACDNVRRTAWTKN